MQANIVTLTGLVSVVVVFTSGAVYFLSKYASTLGLLAKPGAHRLHKQVTPLVGGIAMYLGLLVGVLFVGNSFMALLPSLFLICAVGALDDRYALPSWCRFLAQGIAAYLMMRFS